MNNKDFKQLFDDYYKSVYQRWKINNEKAGKDIVGEEYELFRQQVWENNGFAVTKQRVGSYRPDLVIWKDGNIIAFEEDKGSYVDSCFLKRAMLNYAETISYYLEKGETVPYFVLSCPTTSGTYDKTFNNIKKLFTSEIRKIVEEKFIYLPLCKHDRITSKKGYFANSDSCFTLDDSLLENQNKTFNMLREVKYD